MVEEEQKIPHSQITLTKYFCWKKTTHKEYLESWKDEMEDAFEVAITKSTGRKEKDVRRKWSQDHA